MYPCISCLFLQTVNYHQQSKDPGYLLLGTLTPTEALMVNQQHPLTPHIRPNTKHPNPSSPTPEELAMPWDGAQTGHPPGYLWHLFPHSPKPIGHDAVQGVGSIPQLLDLSSRFLGGPCQGGSGSKMPGAESRPRSYLSAWPRCWTVPVSPLPGS